MRFPINKRSKRMLLFALDHSVKSVRISEFFWSVFPCIRTEHGKIRTRNTPNTDTYTQWVLAFDRKAFDTILKWIYFRLSLPGLITRFFKEITPVDLETEEILNGKLYFLCSFIILRMSILFPFTFVESSNLNSFCIFECHLSLNVV